MNVKFICNHSCIKVSDAERSLAFYKEALGLTVDFVCHHTETITSYFLGDGVSGVQLQLLALPGYQPEHQSYGHFSMSVSEIDASHAYHSAMGCATGPIIDQGHQRSYFVRDPDGYETEIIKLKNISATGG